MLLSPACECVKVGAVPDLLCIFGFNTTFLADGHSEARAGCTDSGGASPTGKLGRAPPPTPRRRPHHVQQDLHLHLQEVVLLLQLLVPPAEALGLPLVHSATQPGLWGRQNRQLWGGGGRVGGSFHHLVGKTAEIGPPATQWPFSNFRLCPARFIVGVP